MATDVVGQNVDAAVFFDEFGHQGFRAPGAKAVLGAGHEGYPKVLGGLQPFQVFFVNHRPEIALLVLGLFPEVQPLIVKIFLNNILPFGVEEHIRRTSH